MFNSVSIYHTKVHKKDYKLISFCGLGKQPGGQTVFGNNIKNHKNPTPGIGQHSATLDPEVVGQLHSARSRLEN